MAEFKKRMLVLSSGKQIKLYGNSIAISKCLEIGEGSVPNLLAEKQDNSERNALNNPYQLTTEELMEVADYNIQLWMDLKYNLRKHGLDPDKLFVKESIR